MLCDLSSVLLKLIASWSFWRTWACLGMADHAHFICMNQSAASIVVFHFKLISTSYLNSFLRYWIFKNSIILLVKSMCKCTWSWFLELSELICCFYGNLLPYKKQLTPKLILDMAELSFCSTLIEPNYARIFHLICMFEIICCFYGCLSTYKKLT